MGGRGASSGMSDSGKPYGSEYRTVLQSGNIKFVVKREGSTSAPLETRSKGRVYVTINKVVDRPAFISYYSNELKRTKTIDLEHMHDGVIPHVHHGYLHNENDGEKGMTNLSTEEKKMVERVNELWYSRKRKGT